MTTLHMTSDDYVSHATGADGAFAIELTEQGMRRLASAVRQHEQAMTEPEQRAVWLRNLPDAELIEVALGRWGGPEADVLDEAVRRLQDLVAKLRPVVGLVSPAMAGPVINGAEE
ncbi:hypothetical protein [Kitasatospora aureofaciens]|uniref:hypothetical protein n=1 Tax=Kitasatospora aureofaciens TaxID=1894 RepID=UPI0033D4EB98